MLYGVVRFTLEMLRQPDRGLDHLAWGLTMGQTLSVPVIAAGVLFVVRSFQAPPAAEPPSRATEAG